MDTLTFLKKASNFGCNPKKTGIFPLMLPALLQVGSIQKSGKTPFDFSGLWIKPFAGFLIPTNSHHFSADRLNHLLQKQLQIHGRVHLICYKKWLGSFVQFNPNELPVLFSVSDLALLF